MTFSSAVIVVRERSKGRRLELVHRRGRGRDGRKRTGRDRCRCWSGRSIACVGRRGRSSSGMHLSAGEGRAGVVLGGGGERRRAGTWTSAPGELGRGWRDGDVRRRSWEAEGGGGGEMSLSRI